MTTRSIDIRNFTQMDYAYIDNQGRVLGNSLHVSAVVTGEVDPVEKVVVDFSQCKKLLKELIDSPIYGYDHKLLGFIDSDCEFEADLDSNIQTVSNRTLAISGSGMFRACHTEHNYRDFAEHIGAFLTQTLSLRLNAPVTVTVTLSDVPVYRPEGLYQREFHYVHGLKDSSSHGCQNIAHGHRSFFELIGDIDDWDIIDENFINKTVSDLARDLDNTIFVRKENVKLNTEEFITFGYESVSRGHFSMTVNKKHQKVIVLDTETTIEYLADYVADRLAHLSEYGVEKIFVSEGLTKGAIVCL